MQLVKAELAPRMQRPRQSVGLRKAMAPYFGTPANAVITIVCVALIALFAHRSFQWLLVDAVFTGGPAACKASDGACWPFFADKLRFMVFGFYPFD